MASEPTDPPEPTSQEPTHGICAYCGVTGEFVRREFPQREELGRPVPLWPSQNAVNGPGTGWCWNELACASRNRYRDLEFRAGHGQPRDLRRSA